MNRRALGCETRKPIEQLADTVDGEEYVQRVEGEQRRRINPAGRQGESCVCVAVCVCAVETEREGASIYTRAVRR